MQRTVPSDEQLTQSLLDFLTVILKRSERGVFEVAAEHDLTLSQLRAISVLAHCDHAPALSELAADVGLTVGAAGRMVDALVRAGLVTRREDAADRRVKRLALTETGAAVIDRIHAGRSASITEFLGQLDDDAREQLAHALTLMPAAETGCGPTDHPTLESSA